MPPSGLPQHLPQHSLPPAPYTQPPTQKAGMISPSGPSNEAQASSGPNTWPGPLPSLHFYPLNDTFHPKVIHLPPGQHVKIGRQTNAKTLPGERNGYFDSKVLSRMHAEVWELEGKVWIKDVKSSNGTFVNGDRLSPEGAESPPYQLHSGDHVEFGIDIIGEDNKTIVHHKVSSKAFCVITNADVDLSMRELSAYRAAQERFAMESRRIANGGQKGNGLSFDHVLNKLANELQKSRETGAELNSLSTAMIDINDTLGGGMPVSISEHVHPDYPPPQSHRQPNGINGHASPPAVSQEVMSALQNQLMETQSSLNEYIQRIQALEGRLKEHEDVKREVGDLRKKLDSANHWSGGKDQGRGRALGLSFNGNHRSSGNDSDEDNDDTMSVGTVRIGRNGEIDDDSDSDSDDDEKGIENGEDTGLYRFSKDQKNQLNNPTTVTTTSAEEEEEDRNSERERLGRPVTPEPGSMNGDKDGHDDAPVEGKDLGLSPSKAKNLTSPPELSSTKSLDPSTHSLANGTSTPLDAAAQADIHSRLDQLVVSLESIATLSSTLQSQHTSALASLSVLESRVASIETTSQATWESWRTKVEDAWKKEREIWESERERMRSVVREWDQQKKRQEEEEEERRSNEEREEEEERERKSRSRSSSRSKDRSLDIDGSEIAIDDLNSSNSETIPSDSTSTTQTTPSNPRFNRHSSPTYSNSSSPSNRNSMGSGSSFLRSVLGGSSSNSNSSTLKGPNSSRALKNGVSLMSATVASKKDAVSNNGSEEDDTSSQDTFKGKEVDAFVEGKDGRHTIRGTGQGRGEVPISLAAVSAVIIVGIAAAAYLHKVKE